MPGFGSLRHSRVAGASGAVRPVCYAFFSGSSDSCDQQHNCQAGGKARSSGTIDRA